MEENQNSEVLEATPPVEESKVIESDEAPVETPKVEDEHEVEDKQDRNWREFRRKQRETEIRVKAQDELIDKLLNAQRAPVQEITPVVDEFEEISEEDFLTKEQSRKMSRQEARAIAKEEVQIARKEQKDLMFIKRLSEKFKDFTDVVNPDSIALLDDKEPELAETIAELKDPYKIGLQTYHYLKGLNFSTDVSEKRHAREVEKKIEKNEKTVQSPQAYNKRPMAQAFKVTAAEQEKLYEEMMGYASQTGFGY